MKVLGCLLKGLIFSLAAVAALVLAVWLPTLWPYLFKPEHTLPISGQVLDAVTGEPVPKALVTVEWVFKRPAVVDSYNWGEVHRAATDAQGRYSIPAHKISKPWSRFLEQGLSVRHPLYAPGGATLMDEERAQRSGAVKDGQVVVEVKIPKLEDRFSKPEDNADLADYFETMGPDFFLHMSHDHQVKYSLSEILEKWNQLATRYPHGNERHGFERLQAQHRRLLFRMETGLKNY